MCKESKLFYFILCLQMTQVVASQEPGEIESPKPFSLINPRTEIVVRQEGPRVLFDFFHAGDFGDTMKKGARNDGVIMVAVANIFGEEIWRIEAPRRGPGASSVTYGVVPKRFAQTIPKGRKAPALKINEDYRVSVEGGGRGGTSFVYRGRK